MFHFFGVGWGGGNYKLTCLGINKDKNEVYPPPLQNLNEVKIVLQLQHKSAIGLIKTMDTSWIKEYLYE